MAGTREFLIFLTRREAAAALYIERRPRKWVVGSIAMPRYITLLSLDRRYKLHCSVRSRRVEYD